MQEACYWIEWMIEFDIICENDKSVHVSAGMLQWIINTNVIVYGYYGIHC